MMPRLLLPLLLPLLVICPCASATEHHNSTASTLPPPIDVALIPSSPLLIASLAFSVVGFICSVLGTAYFAYTTLSAHLETRRRQKSAKFGQSPYAVNAARRASVAAASAAASAADGGSPAGATTTKNGRRRSSAKGDGLPPKPIRKSFSVGSGGGKGGISSFRRLSLRVNPNSANNAQAGFANRGVSSAKLLLLALNVTGIFLQVFEALLVYTNHDTGATFPMAFIIRNWSYALITIGVATAVIDMFSACMGGLLIRGPYGLIITHRHMWLVRAVVWTVLFLLNGSLFIDGILFPKDEYPTVEQWALLGSGVSSILVCGTAVAQAVFVLVRAQAHIRSRRVLRLSHQMMTVASGGSRGQSPNASAMSSLSLSLANSAGPSSPCAPAPSGLPPPPPPQHALPSQPPSHLAPAPTTDHAHPSPTKPPTPAHTPRTPRIPLIPRIPTFVTAQERQFYRLIALACTLIAITSPCSPPEIDMNRAAVRQLSIGLTSMFVFVETLLMSLTVRHCGGVVAGLLSVRCRCGGAVMGGGGAIAGSTSSLNLGTSSTSGAGGATHGGLLSPRPLPHALLQPQSPQPDRCATPLSVAQHHTAPTNTSPLSPVASTSHMGSPNGSGHRRSGTSLRVQSTRSMPSTE
ncbi:hypothetical protein BC831DRAFT_446724 [Entophlyctis helioformis]|nr:hypothetical protein BC831DRAFT_446724 [Entophlyctis helioformis]